MPRLHPSRVLATAAACVATAAALAGCGLVGAAGRHLEPGLGTSYPITNATGQTLRIEQRFQSTYDNATPIDQLLLFQSYPLAPGQTVDAVDHPLAPNDCEGQTIIAYANGKIIARKATPLCADAHGHSGWTITASRAARSQRRPRDQARRRA